jgi:hypothetical protein
MAHPAASAEFRFYEELNDFLPPAPRALRLRRRRDAPGQ